jgi:hypothetical protein
VAKEMTSACPSVLCALVDKQGNAERSCVIQLIGKTEKARMMAFEKNLVAALCTYRALFTFYASIKGKYGLRNESVFGYCHIHAIYQP